MRRRAGLANGKDKLLFVIYEAFTSIKDIPSIRNNIPYRPFRILGRYDPHLYPFICTRIVNCYSLHIVA